MFSDETRGRVTFFGDMKHLLQLKIFQCIILNWRYGFKLGSLGLFCMFYPSSFQSLLIVHFLDATLSTFYILFCCLIDFIRTFGRLTDVGKDLELEVLSACLLSPLSDAGLTNTFLNN